MLNNLTTETTPKKIKMKINKIAILWESETGGGVSSYLKYLLQSKAFKKKKL